MAEMENAVPCMDFNSSAVCLKEDTDSGDTTPVHDHDKFLKEQKAPLYMEDGDEEITSEDEMGMMWCGRIDFDHMDYMDFLQAKQKYLPLQPKRKPLTWEEWDELLTKEEMEGYEMKDLWHSKYPRKEEDAEYTLVWSDTDEE